MSSAAEQIKERLNIVDVVGSYIKLEKGGASYKARCPFHTEKSPSFFVSPARGSYYCFGCGAKGDIFTFVEEFEKVDFIGALKILADKAGIELDQFKSEHKGENEKLRTILEQVTIFFQNKLSQHPRALEYLKSRGLTDETIKEWRIGYAPAEWRTLHDYLVAKGVSVEDMEKVGVVKRSDASQKEKQTVYDRFRSRIMFPLFDTSGRVIAYSGRIFEETNSQVKESANASSTTSSPGTTQSQAPKYLNSPETPLFNKSEVLYGYHKAKEGMRHWKYAILVEGQMDLLMCHQSGFNNTVATSGTSLTLAHLDKIQKMSNNLMIVYDADKAGLKATLRAWTSALSLGMDVKIAGLPAGEDPASILLSNKEKFKEALKHSKHIIDYYIDILLNEQLPERKLWHAVETEVVPYIASIESAIDRSHFITTVSLRTGIPEDALREQVQKQPKNSQQNSPVYTDRSENTGVKESRGTGGPSESMDDKVLQRLIGYILLEKSKHQPQEHIEKLCSRMKTIVGDVDYQGIEKIIEQAPDHIIFEAETMFSGNEKIEKDVEDLFLSLEERVLKNKFGQFMRELQQAERSGEKDKAFHLLQQCQDISLQLSTLQHKRKQL